MVINVYLSFQKGRYLVILYLWVVMHQNLTGMMLA